MGRKVVALILLLSAQAASAGVRRGDQGIGIMLGNPSGVSWKMWMDENIAVDAAAGIDQGEFDVHTTLLWHNFTWARGSSDTLLHDLTTKGDFPFYIGIGPRLLFENKTEFGIRIPFGLTYLPNSSNWDFFFEFAPVLRFTPDTGMDADFGLGARYYFKAIRPVTQ